MMAELFAGYGEIDVTAPAPSYRTFLDWVARSDAAAGQQAWREFLAAATGPTLLATNRRGDTGGASVDHHDLPRLRRAAVLHVVQLEREGSRPDDRPVRRALGAATAPGVLA